MSDSRWTWANLTDEQTRVVREAEGSLGEEVDYLLAFESGNRATGTGMHPPQTALHAAPLNDSQIECLQGLEGKIGAVIGAYQKRGV